MRRNRGASGTSIANSRQQDASSLAKAFDPSRPARPSPLAASTIRGIPVDLVERIRSFSFFAEAPEDFLITIGSCLRLQVFSAQETILHEGDEAKAMYWLIRGSVVAASRDMESVYAELRPGSLFGEIGVLMDVPRTASIVTRSKSLVARLNKEDLQKQLPNYPKVERALREEAAERIAILERRKAQQSVDIATPASPPKRTSKRSYDLVDQTGMSQLDYMASRRDSIKKLKPRGASISADPLNADALASGSVNVRQLLRNLPLFERLPDEFLHFLGLNAEPETFSPFHLIVEQGTTGKDIYFIISGVVEVFTRTPEKAEDVTLARLQAGHFFGEVTSLALSPNRTASVRTVTAVDCLVIRGAVIDELWRRSPPDLRKRVENIAKERLEANAVQARERAPSSLNADISLQTTQQQVPQSEFPAQDAHVLFREVTYQQNPPLPPPAHLEPFDPDPFLNAERSAWRSGPSRRGSAVNVLPAETSPLARDDSPKTQKIGFDIDILVDRLKPLARPRMSSSQASQAGGAGALSEAFLIKALNMVDFRALLRCRRVCSRWQRIISRSSALLHHLDLSTLNRRVTDQVIIGMIAPLVGSRPRSIDLSNCYHVTDEGFSHLVAHCGENVRYWRLKSAWEVGPASLAQLASRSSQVVSLDLSNCRKIGDNLLARLLGWASQHHPPSNANADPSIDWHGCPKLARMILSYCKHVTDRFLHHLAQHASDRLEELDLTRCTEISDLGFRHLAERKFVRLRKLVLADCTFLSDQAIAALIHAAPVLQDLDLSFCCKLSDAAVEMVAYGLQELQRLDLAFCGSAVSDASLAALARGLRGLRVLGVRGCVRVTSAGINAILAGCWQLVEIDVSQCRNLVMDARWQSTGIRFKTVADGKWRVGS